MKYIRTKGGRLLKVFDEDIVEYGDSTCETQGYICGEKGTSYVWKEQVIKQSDTIEELCDCYLCFTKSHKNWITTENYETAKLYAERGCEVNVCILTDKGLIYVAKMNEKGCLELI